MATYRFAKIPAQGERIGYGGGALEISTSAFGDQVVRSMAA